MYLKPLNNANHGDQIIQSSLLIVSQRPGWLCHNVLIVMFGCNTLVLIWNQPEVEYWYCRGFFVVVFFFFRISYLHRLIYIITLLKWFCFCLFIFAMENIYNFDASSQNIICSYTCIVIGISSLKQYFIDSLAQTYVSIIRSFDHFLFRK